MSSASELPSISSSSMRPAAAFEPEKQDWLPKCSNSNISTFRMSFDLNWRDTPDSSELLLQAIALVGEFNGWQPQDSDWAVRNDFGVWELFLPDGADGTPAIAHKCAH